CGCADGAAGTGTTAPSPGCFSCRSAGQECPGGPGETVGAGETGEAGSRSGGPVPTSPEPGSAEPASPAPGGPEPGRAGASGGASAGIGGAAGHSARGALPGAEGQPARNTVILGSGSVWVSESSRRPSSESGRTPHRTCAGGGGAPLVPGKRRGRGATGCGSGWPSAGA